jgi:Protein of unknown function (DUF2846)
MAFWSVVSHPLKTTKGGAASLCGMQRVGQPASFAQQQPSQSATLIFYREGHYGGSARKPSVYIDGIEAGRMKNGSFFSVRIEPGKHNLTSITKREASLVLDVKSGQTSYVQMVMLSDGHFPPAWRLVSVPSDIGSYAVSKLHTLD